MKYIIVSVCLLCFSLYGFTEQLGMGSAVGEGKVEERGIKTKKDYEDFVADMQRQFEMGNCKAGYVLGVLFSKPYELEDKTVILANLDRAAAILEASLEKGVILSSKALAEIYMGKGRMYKALGALEKGLDMATMDQKSHDYIVNMYSAFVMDNFPTDTKAVNNAIWYLNDTLSHEPVATSQFLLASLYNINKEVDKANAYLSMACTNQSAPEELIKICFSSDNIEVENEKDCDTCPTSK